MADSNMRNFDKRMEKILAKHSQLARGYRPAITEDGLIIAEPKRSLWIPWRSVLFILVVGMGFKIFLHATIGAGAYDARVARLAAGTEIEQFGAWIMSADPITLAASAQVAALLD